ncbi:transglutaminase domain-containing protein [Candidatus Woesearchaeota archaeon]|nr:transglutaminase domain-containing protein [Candidatus Woesearchaeota archaeon]
MRKKLIGRVFKETLFWSALYAFNALGPRVSDNYLINQREEDVKVITESMDLPQTLQKHDLRGRTALEYLQIAQIITANNIDAQINNEGHTIEERVERKIGDCEEFSRFTYANFQTIVKATGNEQMLDSVRYANNSKTNHAWLEVKIEGKWKPFETTLDLPNNSIEYKKLFSIKINRNYGLATEKDEYIPECTVQILPAERKVECQRWTYLKELRNYEGFLGQGFRRWLSQK